MKVTSNEGILLACIGMQGMEDCGWLGFVLLVGKGGQGNQICLSSRKLTLNATIKTTLTLMQLVCKHSPTMCTWCSL